LVVLGGDINRYLPSHEDSHRMSRLSCLISHARNLDLTGHRLGLLDCPSPPSTRAAHHGPVSAESPMESGYLAQVGVP
jgi:hypothetical protein